jgi:putative spermidine/putrescine transport system permease protein
VIMPMLAIVPLSFNAEPFFSYPIRDFSLRWYEDFFHSAEWMLALKNSLIIASAVVVLATLLGTLAALGLTLAEFPMKGLVVGLLISPMMVPHIITGVGLFFLFASFNLLNTRVSLILAHTLVATPFVVMTVSVTLANFNVNLIRAASNLGAGPLTAFRRIILPLILPGVLSGALFAFVASFDELIITILLAGSENRTLPRQIWSGVREEVSPVITAVATLLMAFAVLAMLIMEWMRRRSEKMRAAQVAIAP